MSCNRLAIALLLLAPLPITPAAAQAPGFARIGEIAEYRIDGIRTGVHEGVPVRFLDMSLRNTSANTTFPGTMQEIWWQGRQSGAEVKALHRDGSAFGRFEYVKPGELVSVTYPVPDREEIDGVTVEYPHARGVKKKRIAWTALEGPAGPEPSAPAAREAAPAPVAAAADALAGQARAAGRALLPEAKRRLKTRFGGLAGKLLPIH